MIWINIVVYSMHHACWCGAVEGLTRGESKVATRLRRKPSPGLWTKSSEKRFKYKCVNGIPHGDQSGSFQWSRRYTRVHGCSGPENKRRKVMEDDRRRLKFDDELTPACNATNRWSKSTLLQYRVLFSRTPRQRPSSLSRNLQLCRDPWRHNPWNVLHVPGKL